MYPNRLFGGKIDEFDIVCYKLREFCRRAAEWGGDGGADSRGRWKIWVGGGGRRRRRRRRSGRRSGRRSEEEVEKEVEEEVAEEVEAEEGAERESNLPTMVSTRTFLAFRQQLPRQFVFIVSMTTKRNSGSWLNRYYVKRPHFRVHFGWQELYFTTPLEGRKTLQDRESINPCQRNPKI